MTEVANAVPIPPAVPMPASKQEHVGDAPVDTVGAFANAQNDPDVLAKDVATDAKEPRELGGLRERIRTGEEANEEKVKENAKDTEDEEVKDTTAPADGAHAIEPESEAVPSTATEQHPSSEETPALPESEATTGHIETTDADPTPGSESEVKESASVSKNVAEHEAEVVAEASSIKLKVKEEEASVKQDADVLEVVTGGVINEDKPKPVKVAEPVAEELSEGQVLAEEAVKEELTATNEVPVAAQKTVEAGGPAKEEELVKLGGKEQTVDDEPVKVEASEAAPAPESAPIELSQDEVKPQEIETAAKPEAETATDSPKESNESTSTQDEKPIDNEQPAVDVVEQETPATAAKEPLELPAAEPSAPDPASLEPTAIEAKQPQEEVQAPAPSEPESSASPAAPEDPADDSAKKAYELAHAHVNDEVTFKTPTDEELKAATSIVDVVPSSTEDKKEVEEPVAVPKSDVKEEHMSESGMESLSSIPTKTGETPSVVPEEGAVPLISEEAEAKESAAPEVEPEVAAGVAGSTEAAATETKEIPKAVEPEATVAEEPVDAAVSVDAPSVDVSEVVEQEEKPTSSESLEPEAPKDEPSPSVTVPTEESVVVVTEETKEISSKAPAEAATEPAKTVEELVLEPATDAPVEVGAEETADPTADGSVEPKEVPSVEEQVENLATGAEPTEQANPEQEVSASVPVIVEAQEETSLEADAMKHDVEELQEETERQAAEVPVPVSTETELSTSEAVNEETATRKATTLKEPSADHHLDITETVTATEPAQDAPDVQPSESEAVPTEVAKPPAALQEGEPGHVDAAGTIPEATEEGGAAEPAATPALGEAEVQDELATSVERVDKLLEKENAELAPSETPAAEAKEHAAGAELAADESTEVVAPGTAATVEVVEKVIPPAENVAVTEVAVESVEVATGKDVLETEKGVPAAEKGVIEETAEPKSTEAAERAAAEANESIAKEETKAEATIPPSEQETETIVHAEEMQEVVVPNVLVETPTPMSETLAISYDEDEDDSDIPLEARLAKAVGIPPEVLAKLRYTGPAETNDEATTPTATKGKGIPEEGEVKEEPQATEAQDLETLSQSLLFERPDEDAPAAPVEPSLNADVTEAPERSKSPWTASYSVTTQGTSPVHPEAPIEEPVLKNVDVDVKEVKLEKDDTAVESVPTEPVVAPSDVKAEVPADESEVPTELAPAEEVPSAVDIAVAEEATSLVKDDVDQEHALTTEDQDVRPSVQIAAAEDTEAPIEVAPVNLSVDTTVPEVPERPKSPWTPSYSVTKMGPGINESEELQPDADVSSESKEDVGPAVEVQEIAPEEQSHAEAPEVPGSVPVIERPKSPYLPAYSVTQMGPGMVDEYPPASPVSENAAESVAESDEPEAPSSPRSELGAVTPGFDSLSEVSEASHIPIPPSSPRTDPEAGSIAEADAKTPLVVVPDDQETPVSPLQTPLMATDKALEVLDATKPLTESAVSGFEADVENSITTGSWVKGSAAETESYEDVGAPGAESSDSNNVSSEDVVQSPGESEAPAIPESNILTESIQNDEAPTVEAQKVPEIPTSVPELTIPKLDVRAASPQPQPIVVTNTLSTGSAYTQVSLSPFQETGTAATTPDVEIAPTSKLHAGSEIESLEEGSTSNQPCSSDSATTTLGKGKSLGVAHTLAMRSFPSAFAETEGPTTSEEPMEPQVANTLGVDDQLSPLQSRRRLESTVSSLAFPGGWVSSPSNKERPSLETATGEFSKPVVGGNPISPDTTPPATETASEQKESKWRCVIM